MPLLVLSLMVFVLLQYQWIQRDDIVVLVAAYTMQKICLTLKQVVTDLMEVSLHLPRKLTMLYLRKKQRPLENSLNFTVHDHTFIVFVAE